MKLYIPTCTLNFNNIFSTESISPASHYAKRGFGNKRYYKVEANNLDNVILLYSEFPHYHVDDKEIENHSLVIEIESDDYPEAKFALVNEINDVQVYASSSTIYFNPFHCFVYFDGSQDLISVMTKADQSLENKYCKLYRDNFGIYSKGKFEWNKSFLNNAICVDFSDTKEDLFVDRLKGCIVCYLLGANMSISQEASRIKQLARMMKNTLSAIVNSPNKRPTDLQDETLLSYIKEFNEIYSNIDENSIYNNETISKNLISPSTNLDRETLKKILRDLHLEGDFYRRLNLRHVYDAKDLYNCLYSDPNSLIDSYANEIKKLDEAVRKVEIIEQTKNTKKNYDELLSVQNKEIKVVDNVAGTGNFISSLLNSLIAGEYKKFMEDNETEELLSIAFVGGAKLKELLSSKWENSEYQKYINSLLANMQKGERFEIRSIDNVTLQSFAIFCQKGEDIGRLTDYMLQCGFNEYRFALGIYGATKGFATLPKTFTNALLNESRDYYIEFYKKLHKAIFDYELNNTEVQNINLYNSKQSQDVLKSSLSNDVLNSGCQATDNRDIKTKSIPDCLKRVFNSDEFHSMPEKAQSYYEEKSLELWNGKNDKDFKIKLGLLSESCPVAKTKTKWKDALKVLSSKTVSQSIQWMFSDIETCPIEQSFYHDKKVWYHIESLISDEKAKKKIKSDLEWFQEQFLKPKGQRQYYDDVDETNNGIVIEKFCSLKMGKNDRGQEKAPYFTTELREMIKSKLKELYNIN